MFANFGEDQQRRDRLAKQNKEHLDALRAQLEADRARKRNDRSGIAAPPQRFLPGHDPSNVGAPPVIKAPPAGSPYYAARQLAPDAAPPQVALNQAFGIIDQWRGPAGEPPPMAAIPAAQEAPAPSSQVYERVYPHQDVDRANRAQPYENGYSAQRDLREPDMLPNNHHQQQEADYEDDLERQRQNEYIRKQEMLAARRQAPQPPQQLIPLARPFQGAFAPNGLVGGAVDNYNQPADVYPPAREIYSAPAPRGDSEASTAVLVERIAQLERLVDVSTRENRDLRDQCNALQVTLQTSLRMADEKLNQEIRQRAELQMQVHTNAVIGEKESASAGSSVEQLNRQVELLTQKHEEQEEVVRSLVASLTEAREAREAAERVGNELSQVAYANQAKAEELAERDEFNNRAIEEVQSNLLANAEQVGEELRARSQAIEEINTRATEQAAAASSHISNLETQLRELMSQHRDLLVQLDEERKERAAMEARAEEARIETERAFAQQQAMLKASTDAALQEVSSQLEQRERAEVVLLNRLRAQHQQQGQLEDVGVSVQAANAQTFEDMRAALQAVDANVQIERAARDEAISGVLREIMAQAEARTEELKASEARAAEAHATLEQVLRTEIKARMRGESQLQATQKQQNLDFLSGQRALQGDLQEAVIAIRGQVRAAVVENAQHSTRTEEALVRAAERQRNVDAAHELALQALAKQLSAQAEASAEALRAAERGLKAELLSLDERKTAELEEALDTMEERLVAASEHAAAQLDEARDVLLRKVEEAIDLIMQERGERMSAEVEATASRAVRDAINSALASSQQRQHEEALHTTAQAIETARHQLFTEVGLAREAAAEATAEVAALVDSQAAGLEGLQAEAERLHELVAQERHARFQALAVEEQARREADDEAQVAAVLERLVCTLVEETAKAERVALVDEAQRLRAADFTIHANLGTLREAIARSSEAVEDGLRELEQHCAHQLQHGLDALGSNLEHLIETGVGLEAMERQNACSQLAAVTASQLDSLEGLVHSQRAATAAEFGELHVALEVKDCVDRLMASLEEAERVEEMGKIVQRQAALSARVEEMGPELIDGIRATAIALEESSVNWKEELTRLAAAHETLASDMVLGHERHAQALAEETAARVAASTEMLVSLAEARADADEAITSVRRDLADSAVRTMVAQLVSKVEADALLTASLADIAETRELIKQQGEEGQMAVRQVEVGLSARLASSVKKLEERQAAAETDVAARFDAASRAQKEEAETRRAALEETAVNAAVEETLERAIQALEVADEIKRHANQEKRLASVERALLLQREEAHEVEKASEESSSKLTKLVDAEIARLATRMDKAKEVQEEELVKLRSEIEAKGEARETALQEKLVDVKMELVRAKEAAEAAVKACEDKVKQAEEQADRVAAEIRGLKTGLGLSGEATDPLAKASELKRLREYMEAELAEARADLKRSHERFVAAAERMTLEADEGAKQAEARRLQAEAARAAAQEEAAKEARRRSHAEAEALTARAEAAMEAAGGGPGPSSE